MSFDEKEIEVEFFALPHCTKKTLFFYILIITPLKIGTAIAHLVQTNRS